MGTSAARIRAAIGKGVLVAVGATPIVLRDVFGLSGAAAIAYGAWLHYPPAGFVIGGAEIVAAVWLSARADRKAGD